MIIIQCRCGETIEGSDPCYIDQQICGQCARIGCYSILDDVEWCCPECGNVGKYNEIPRNSGVDPCPDCRSPIDDVEE